MIGSGKAIPRSVFQLHEVQCSRARFKCECGEVVEKVNREKHTKEQHADITCGNCGLKAKAYIVHKHECMKKPIICDFCEGEIAFDLYESHRESCANRTTPCDICMKYIRMVDLKTHIASHSRPEGVEEEKQSGSIPLARKQYQTYVIPVSVRRPFDPQRTKPVDIPRDFSMMGSYMNPPILSPNPSEYYYSQ